MNRSLALLLCLAMLASTTACGNGGESETTDTTPNPADTTATTPVETEPEETLFTADIPEGTDFGGASFTVLTYPLEGNLVWNDTDWVNTEQNGEVLNDAVYERTMQVNELLNVNIKGAPAPGINDISALENTVKAGDNAYQLAYRAMGDTFSIAQKGILAELNAYAAEGTLDLTAPWWDQNILGDLSIDHKNYCITGDIGTMYKKSIGVIMFNKAIQLDNNLPDYYAMMEEGKWTIDNMVASGVTVSEDLNGDGAMTNEDRFGLICFCDMMSLAMIGGGVEFFTKDANDIPAMSFYSERSVSVMEKLAKLMYDPNLAYSWSKAGVGEGPAFDMYQADQSLFYYGELHAVASMRDMESPFGILPMPKYDEAQDEYYHCINPHVAAVYVIPKSNIERDQTGYIMDALGAASKNILTPAYYDKTLRGKVSRDEESAASLDIVISTIRYDLGYLGNWGISSTLNTMADSYNMDLASKIGTIEKNVTTRVEQMVEVIRGLDE